MDPTPQKILIVEDEPDLASLLAQYATNAGFCTQVIRDGREAEPWITMHNPSLIVLDLMLPGKSGLDICKDIRSHDHIPIIITTARVEEIDRLLGLELGADDYICKPYSPREVVARIKTVLRRTEVLDAGHHTTEQEITIDPDKLQITVKKTTLELTQIELNLFTLLFNDPGHIFSRQNILDNIYHDYRIVSDRTVDSHIKKLRKKLHCALPETDLIKSIYGVGYKFEPDFSKE